MKQCYWILASQFGMDPIRGLRAIRALPSYIADYIEFSRGYDGPIHVMPYLHDRTQEGGDSHSEYFIQDLTVAKQVYERNPQKHVDVGSRVDGFVAHVASFRKIEVLDIRPIMGKIPGIEFRQIDLMNVNLSPADYCDSLSCLHALEHFGLGRYGDPIDPLGWRSGLSSLSRLLTRGGRLYLSMPVGKEKVVFNAHRVLAPSLLINGAREFGLRLDRLSWISGGELHVSDDFAVDVIALGETDYSLGIFEFLKE
jgi:hypothetical protein